MNELYVLIIGLAIMTWPFMKIYSNHLDKKIKIIKEDNNEIMNSLKNIIATYNLTLLQIEGKSDVRVQDYMTPEQMQSYQAYKNHLMLKFGDLDQMH